MKFTVDNEEYLDLKDLEKLVGMKQTLIYEKIRHNKFPKSEKKQVKITFLRKRSLWKRSEIDAYLEKTREEKE
jgi:predicted DNA-binding transcriptional regulator AlpA